MQPFCAEFKVPNASNAMNHINPNIIANSDGVAKLTPRQTFQGWKPRKANLAPIYSSARIATVTIRQTPINVSFGDTDSIGNGTRGSTLRSGKTNQNQFVLKQTALLTNDRQKPQNIFAEHSQKFSHHHHSSRNINSVRHHLNPGTAIV